MLALDISEFMIELKEGTIRNVGGPTKSASAKLFDVTDAEARPFGNDRIKFVFADDDGNEIQVALFASEIQTILDDVESIAESTDVFDV